MAKWIQKAIKHPGALHESLDIPMEKKIPMRKLKEAAKSKSAKLRKRAVLAMTLKKMHK